jgi:hypothetical protein
MSESARGPRRPREFHCCNYISPLVLFFFLSDCQRANEHACSFFFFFPFVLRKERRAELPSADYVCIAGAAAKVLPPRKLDQFRKVGGFFTWDDIPLPFSAIPTELIDGVCELREPSIYRVVSMAPY